MKDTKEGNLLRERVKPQIKQIIVVGSGKGGVGKSTVALHLAIHLAKSGARVGILDADIYGPSQPTLLGTLGQKPALNNQKFKPVSVFLDKEVELQSMSIGYLIAPEVAMVWRGPMLGKAIEQMLYDTEWNNLDYLIVDLPPGTGDVQLTLCQKMNIAGAIVVTTPQDLALLDVRRACDMFMKLQVKILGVIENMSIHHCPTCGHAAHLFGKDGGQQLATELHLPFLGAIPLDIAIREQTDSGQITKLYELAMPHTVFAEIVIKILKILEQRPKDYSAKFPKIKVEYQQKESNS